MHNHDRRPSTCATSRPHRAASRPARGQALIETAIGIVLLLLLTFSIVDAAMLFYTYLTLENGVTEATRFAVTGQQTSDPANPTTALSREDSIKRVMRSSTPGLEIPDREFRFDDISQPGTPGAGNPNDVIQITVTHPYRLISPMVRPLVGNGGVINLRVSATMRNEPYPQ